MSETATVIGYIIIGIAFFYFCFKSLNIQLNVMENFVTMTRNTDETANSGISGKSSTTANGIGEQTIKMQDIFLIKKYRQNYENLIINSDDYISYLMLYTLMNLKLDDSEDSKKLNIELFGNIKMLNDSKVSLNALMKFIDSV